MDAPAFCRVTGGNVRSVADSPADRTADTRVPIHPPIAARWSPRAFDPDAVVDTEQLTALLEAYQTAAAGTDQTATQTALTALLDAMQHADLGTASRTDSG